MRQTTNCRLLQICAVVGLLLGTVAEAHSAEVELNGHRFTLPDGFEIELAAGPPLADRPITIAFDEQGRLYVADSSGSNDPVQKQLAEKPHRILRLEDTDGDGRYDRRTVFADRMMFPEGTMWYDGSLYVSAPPSIWKLTDTDGDGVADERVEWFLGKTLTGCANDLHGPYLGPDGWIYWCKGAFAEQTYERPGKRPLVTKASHIFRCRPDGTGIEAVMTGGMDNPVDVAFTPGGEPILSATFLQHPAGGRRDGLLHAVYGGLHGKEHAVLDGHVRTSREVLPALSHRGPAAACGLHAYQSNVFGDEYRFNLFTALFNLQKITRHVLTPDGATFASQDSDFLVSDNRDFHPTDVIEDADGSLLVVDTGGWYKLCCPTSQLDKPDVLGGIYRIRRTDAPRVNDPRGLGLAWSRMDANDLAKLLGDTRPAVRERATQALAKLGRDAVLALQSAIESSPSADVRRQAVWAATRIEHPDARAAVRPALDDSDELVRQAALHCVALHRDAAATAKLERLLDQPSAQNRRAAAQALGRIGSSSSVAALLEAAGREPSDRFLQHSLILALIEIADAGATAEGLDSANLLVRRAALIALDQMEGSHLRPEQVVADLTSEAPVLRETAAWIVSRHSQWGGALAGFLRERLTITNLSEAGRDELVGQLAQFAGTPAIAELMATRLSDATAPREEQRTVLRAMAQSRLKPVPADWLSGLEQVLAAGDAELIGEAIAAIRALPIAPAAAGPLVEVLLSLAGDETQAAELRVESLAAVPGGLTKVEPALFEFLTAQLDPERPVGLRTVAAEVLGHARLNGTQLSALAGRLDEVGPLEIDRLLTAYERSTDEALGLEVLASLKKSAAASAVRPGTFRTRLQKFGPKVQEQAEAFFATLRTDTADQKARLETLLATMPEGDIRRGQAVFNSQKAACVSCHAIGYRGGKIGPDLTRIGKIRDRRDLLESVMFPSASFVRSYEPVLIVTVDGRVVSGVVKDDAPHEVVLVTGPNPKDEARIARDDIEEMQPGTVSIMPAGLDKQLSPQDLADLIEFLKACQ